jgi:hypothetical protein
MKEKRGWGGSEREQSVKEKNSRKDTKPFFPHKHKPNADEHNNVG